jgi:SNF2 family DNA or RNA helicase
MRSGEDLASSGKELPALPIRTDAWPHQKQAYWWALPRKAAYLAMSMGTGKSLVTVALHQGRSHRRTLILAPKAVVGGWPNQFFTHGYGEAVVAALTEGSIAKRVEQAELSIRQAEAMQRSAVVVTNYEAVPQPAMKAFIAKAGFDFVVCDEIHRLKSPNGLVSKTVYQLFRGRDIYRLGLSGTPLPHSPLDIYAQMRFLDPTVFSWPVVCPNTPDREHVYA